MAKLASEEAKPRVVGRRIERGLGVKEVPVGTESEFLGPLPLRALWGVGPKTADKLSRFGITTVGELANLPEQVLIGTVGDANGRHLHAVSNGRDPRPVEPNRPTKSISQEETYPTDISESDSLHRQLVRLSDGVASRVRQSGHHGRTVTIKVRVASFETITRAKTLDRPTNSRAAILATASELLENLLIEREVLHEGVRLLGVGVSQLTTELADQLSLDDLMHRPPARATAVAAPAAMSVADAASSATDQAIDDIRSRFGPGAIGSARLLGPEGMEPSVRGRQQWGPNRSRPDESGRRKVDQDREPSVSPKKAD